MVHGRCLARALAFACATSAAAAATCKVTCPSTPVEGPAPGRSPMDLNGVKWPDLCIPEEGSLHFFAIGDWGGVGAPPKTFDNTVGKRPFVTGVDDQAQQLVASRMVDLAEKMKPEFVINVGDNFYPGGVNTYCGATDSCTLNDGGRLQWDRIFDEIYRSPALDNAPWMGVLGNHDYGGWEYDKGWDQSIAYTWHSSRWLTPALYWQRHVQYCNFSIDFFFIDSNVADALPPDLHPTSNICARNTNKNNCSAVNGPIDPEDCYLWFAELWKNQSAWLEPRLAASDADWQVIVTHFPPEYHLPMFRGLSEKYGVDLIITGHRHQQEVHYKDALLGDTAWIVTGGGGGITSESDPIGVENDVIQQYGFMDLTMTKETIKIKPHSFTGRDWPTLTVYPRLPAGVTTSTATPTWAPPTYVPTWAPPTYVPTMPPSTTAPSDTCSASCWRAEGCRGQVGNCCPNDNGVMMDCCTTKRRLQPPDQCSASRRRHRRLQLIEKIHMSDLNHPRDVRNLGTASDESDFESESDLSTEGCFVICGCKPGYCEACGRGKACCFKDDPSPPPECGNIFGNFVTGHYECVLPVNSTTTTTTASASGSWLWLIALVLVCLLVLLAAAAFMFFKGSPIKKTKSFMNPGYAELGQSMRTPVNSQPMAGPAMASMPVNVGSMGGQVVYTAQPGVALQAMPPVATAFQTVPTYAQPSAMAAPTALSRTL